MTFFLRCSMQGIKLTFRFILKKLPISNNRPFGGFLSH
jgi:hypothetical protein